MFKNENVFIDKIKTSLIPHIVVAMRICTVESIFENIRIFILSRLIIRLSLVYLNSYISRLIWL